MPVSYVGGVRIDAKTPFVYVFSSLHPGVRVLPIPSASFTLSLLQMTLLHVLADCFPI